MDAPEPLIGLGQRCVERLRHLLEVRVQLLQDPIRAGQDLLPGQVFQRPRGQEDPVDRQLLPQLLQAGAERLQAFGNGAEHALFPHQQALFLQVPLQARLLVSLEGFFEPRQGRQPLLDLAELLARPEDPLALALQRPAQLPLPVDDGIVPLHEASEQPGQLLRALGELRDLVLAVDLDTGKDLRRQDVQHFAGLPVAHDRGIRDGALDPVVPRARAMAADEERYLGAVSEHVLENPRVARSGLFAEGLQPEHVAQALDDGGLARPASAHQHVQVRVEAEHGPVQEAALPSHRDELGVFLGGRVAVQPDPRAGVEEGLPQAFDADLRHLDPAGRRRVGQVFRGCYVAGVHRREGEVCFRCVSAGVVGVSIPDDELDIVREIPNRAGDLDGVQVLVPPGPDPRLSLKHLEQSAVVRGVRRDRDAALAADAREEVRKGLLTGVARRLRRRDPESSEEELQLFLGGLRGVEAEHVYPFGGGQLEAREDGDAPLPGHASDRVHPADVVVVRHRQHGDPELCRLVRQRPRVARFVERRRLPAVRPGVMVRIDLEGALVELGAGREIRDGGDGIVCAHAPSPEFRAGAWRKQEAMAETPPSRAPMLAGPAKRRSVYPRGDRT